MSQTLFVFQSQDVIASSGVGEGDCLAFADELILDDCYQVQLDAQLQSLALTIEAERQFYVTKESAIGSEGQRVALDCCVTFMAPNGATYEALIFVALEQGRVCDVYLMPFAPLDVGVNYRLINVDKAGASERFAQSACVSFTKGTRITMATGVQVPVEALSIGDMVLTRDDGPQALRWVGQTTTRAVGAFAPVVISKGALNNIEDLVVSPDHRLFVYQRKDTLGVGRSEVLVKARNLINGKSVYQKDGGFVEYYQLLFDEHQIVFAEGIAAETLLLTPRTSAAFTAGDGKDAVLREHAHRQHFAYDVGEQLAGGANTVELLKQASTVKTTR